MSFFIGFCFPVLESLFFDHWVGVPKPASLSKPAKPARISLPESAVQSLHSGTIQPRSRFPEMTHTTRFTLSCCEYFVFLLSLSFSAIL